MSYYDPIVRQWLVDAIYKFLVCLYRWRILFTVFSLLIEFIIVTLVRMFLLSCSRSLITSCILHDYKQLNSASLKRPRFAHLLLSLGASARKPSRNSLFVMLSREKWLHFEPWQSEWFAKRAVPSRQTSLVSPLCFSKQEPSTVGTINVRSSRKPRPLSSIRLASGDGRVGFHADPTLRYVWPG